MWIPASASDLEAALGAGGLEESATLDGKADLPNNPELAVDICAMTAEGGVLLFGVKENAEGTRLVAPNPIPLRGQRERIAQVAETAISEPPTIDVRALDREAGGNDGYLVVVVPQSARAPHQIVMRGKYEGRYYGRAPQETGS